MKKLLFISTIIVLAISTSFAQRSNVTVKEINNKASIVTRGGNDFIKSEIPETDEVSDKTTSNEDNKYKLSIENSTVYFVKVYVDGCFKTTLSPYGYSEVPLSKKGKNVYAITSGGSKYWYFKPENDEEPSLYKLK